MNTGYEVKVCVDINNCGTENYKPAEESRRCSSILNRWYFWVVLGIILLGIILLLLFFVIFPYIRRKKKAELTKLSREESEGEKSIVGKKKVNEETASAEESGKASAASDALVTYVKDAKAAGMSKDEIKDKLIGAGWPQGSVDDALKSF